jgi:hypothetical protein
MDRLDDGQDERTNSVLLNFRASKSLAIFATPALDMLPPQFPLTAWAAVIAFAAF